MALNVPFAPLMAHERTDARRGPGSSPNLAARRIRMSVGVLIRLDLSALERVGNVQVFIARTEDQIRIVRGHQSAGWLTLLGRQLFKPNPIVFAPHDEVSSPAEDRLHQQRFYPDGVNEGTAKDVLHCGPSPVHHAFVGDRLTQTSRAAASPTFAM